MEEEKCTCSRFIVEGIFEDCPIHDNQDEELKNAKS